MKIEMSHVRIQGINCAVFQADARDQTDGGRRRLLSDLVAEARRNRLRVDKAALAYSSCGRIEFFGAPDLVDYLADAGVPGRTHVLTV